MSNVGKAVEAIYQRPKTSRTGVGAAHRVLPYLLAGVPISRPNQVWAADITFIPMPAGFAYLVAIMDVFSRRVLAWRLSNTMEPRFCVDALHEALELHGVPEVFNSDQGAQFTSRDFASVLEGHGVAISMDGRGRWIDSVFIERFGRSLKYEHVYLHAYEDLTTADTGSRRTSGTTTAGGGTPASLAARPTPCTLAKGTIKFPSPVTFEAQASSPRGQLPERT